jgi:hypothetical protein
MKYGGAGELGKGIVQNIRLNCPFIPDTVVSGQERLE